MSPVLSFLVALVACSLSAVLGLHILPCEPGMAGPMGCSNFGSRQSGPNFIAPEFRDRGLGDRGFGERFGSGLQSDFLGGGIQDNFIDGGMQDFGGDQFIGGGIQDQFIGGGLQNQIIDGGDFLNGGFDSGLGLQDSSFGSDQGIFMSSGGSGISGIGKNMGSVIDPSYPKGMGGRFGSRGSISGGSLGISSRMFGKGKSRGRISTPGYPKGSGKFGGSFSRMSGLGGTRGFPKFNSGIMSMGKGLSRSTMSYPKGGRGRRGGFAMRFRGGYPKTFGMRRSSFKGMGMRRMPGFGSWGRSLGYPKGGMSKPLPLPRRTSGGY